MMRMINEHANIGRVQREVTGLKEALSEKTNWSDVNKLRLDVDRMDREHNYDSRLNEIQEEIYRQRSLMENMQHDQAKLHNEVVTQRELTDFANQTTQDTTQSILETINPQINDLWNGKVDKGHITEFRNSMTSELR